MTSPSLLIPCFHPSTTPTSIFLFASLHYPPYLLTSLLCCPFHLLFLNHYTLQFHTLESPLNSYLVSLCIPPPPGFYAICPLFFNFDLSHYCHLPPTSCFALPLYSCTIHPIYPPPDPTFLKTPFLTRA